MKLLTKIKVSATLIALVGVVTLGFGVLNPGYNPKSVDKENRQTVLLRVTTAVIGNDPLITWSQSLTPPMSEPVTTQMWEREVRTYQGDLIVMGIDQLASGLTEGFILHHGQIVKRCWIEWRGSTSCQYRVAG